MTPPPYELTIDGRRACIGPSLVLVLAFAAGGAAVESLFLVGYIPTWVVGVAGAFAALHGGHRERDRKPRRKLGG